MHTQRATHVLTIVTHSPSPLGEGWGEGAQHTSSYLPVLSPSPILGEGRGEGAQHTSNYLPVLSPSPILGEGRGEGAKHTAHQLFLSAFDPRSSAAISLSPGVFPLSDQRYGYCESHIPAFPFCFQVHGLDEPPYEVLAAYRSSFDL
jgi:hypothetical protein